MEVYHEWEVNAVAKPAGPRKVELVVNGQPVAHRMVPADGRVHTLEFKVPVSRSSWMALRQFPQLHTNPVTVQVDHKPIRASRQSARWSIECIKQLWRVRQGAIAESEREEARKTFWEAIKRYEAIAAEAE